MARHPGLAAVLVAVLTAIPAVRTACALSCDPTPAVEVAAGHDAHCAPSDPAPSTGAEVAALPDCTSCDAMDARPRVAMRSASASASATAVALAPSVDLRPFDGMAAPVERCASPPYPTQFPLRI